MVTDFLTYALVFISLDIFMGSRHEIDSNFVLKSLSCVGVQVAFLDFVTSWSLKCDGPGIKIQRCFFSRCRVY